MGTPQRVGRSGIPSPSDVVCTAGRIDHPNVVTIYDVAEGSGVPFLAHGCVADGYLRRNALGSSTTQRFAVCLGAPCE